MQTVFNKLFKNNKPKKVGLKKLELSVKDDFLDQLQRLEAINDEASYYAYQRFEEILDSIYDFQSEISKEVDNQIVNSEVNYPEEAFRDIQDTMASIEIASEGLGINPKELIPEFDDALTLMEEYKKTYEDYRDAYQKVVDVSGFLAQF